MNEHVLLLLETIRNRESDKISQNSTNVLANTETLILKANVHVHVHVYCMYMCTVHAFHVTVMKWTINQSTHPINWFHAKLILSIGY